MKAMPEKLAKHNQEITSRKPKKDLPQLIKRVLTLSKSNVQYRKRDF